MGVPIVDGPVGLPIEIGKDEQKQRFPRINNFLGHTVHFIGDTLDKTVMAVKFCVVNTLITLNAIKLDADAFCKVFRGLGYGFIVLKECGVEVLQKLNTRAADVVNLIDAVQIFSDIQYFATLQFLDDSIPQVIGRTCLAAADVGGVLLWAEELGFGPSRIAAAIGSVRCFSFITLIPLGHIVTGFTGVGFFFMGADAAWRLYQTVGKTTEEDPNLSVKRIKAALDLTWCGLEVIGKITVLVTAVFITTAYAPLIIGVLGVISAGVGLTAFVYGFYNHDRINSKDNISDVLSH